jgi:1,4-dihydroxy-2-naphthoate octaprenyltransferase
MFWKKFKAHVIQLPRPFAFPFFACSILLGSLLAGSINLNAWIGLIAGLLITSGGHAFNSFLDYAWTGLDKGTPEERSAEKGYTGGQNLIASGVVSVRETALNGLAWYALSIIPIVFLGIRTGWLILVPWLLGLLMTVWYSKAKFNWTHELALGVAVGPVAMLLGMYAVSPNPPWVDGLIVSVPVSIILSFAGLAFDEWEDAEANLKKGVKSLAYMVWKYSDLSSNEQERQRGVKSTNTLLWYLSTWILFVVAYHVFLIATGYLHPLSGLAFISIPGAIACMVFLPADFKKVGKIFAIVAAFYPILLLIGEIIAR